MTDRWTLNRAGIINVYQYGRETFHFAGGRLLLRGVNGSGKSTAMNMLLPFLLDGDTRRIDSAGEQAGVLKSWMLSGRDDAQPVGYLWLELARGEDHLSCGCGIKANRSSDTVSTWWWVTSRRPGIDLSLVEDHHPLSMEALRAALGADPVFRQEQRGQYRVEVRNRLFGGADIDQHIRLLHIVRNPRVWDRIDLDLPGHLHDALPQLSDTALLDAAQPLDDLEEHRRNVGDLTRTASTLEALGNTYSSYARAELRARAGQARRLADAADRARRQAAEASAHARGAERALAAATEQVERLTADEVRLGVALGGLKESPAYTEGSQLKELRDRVRDLALAADRAASLLAERTTAGSRAGQEVEAAAGAAAGDRDTLVGRLRDLADHVVDAGLPIGAPDVPKLSATTLAPGTDMAVPAEAVDDAGAIRRFEELRAAVVHRRGDVEEVRRELAAVDEAERRLRQASDAFDAALADADGKREAFAECRQTLDRAASAWRAHLGSWVRLLDEHRMASGLTPAVLLDLETGLVRRRDDIAEAMSLAADEAVAHHVEALAVLEARRRHEQAEVDERAAAVAALDAIVVPAPPAHRWQRPGREVVLAELIDFREEVNPEQQAGIEAAMEAAGLLGAEVTADGVLVADGGLVVRAGPPADEPLSRLLTVTEALPEVVDAAAVTRLLDTISIEPAHLDGNLERTVVTVDGRFRTGMLRGRHHKAEAEHIGLTARRAALERQRVESRRRYDEAMAILGATAGEVAARGQLLADARAIRAGVPPARNVHDAVVAAEVAERDLTHAQELATHRQRDRNVADEVHAERAEKSRRIAANLGLPAQPDGLRAIERALNDVHQMTHRAGDALTALRRAMEQWSLAAERWRQAVVAVGTATEALVVARAESEPQASRLATLEASVGVAYAEILASIESCEAELKTTRIEMGRARSAELEHKGGHATALARAGEMARTAEIEIRQCVAELPRLRRAFAVPGLLAAATDHGAALREPVEDSPAGVRALAAAVDAHVPPPRVETTADSVRQSLRQRRDTLGAGWDADDRQADATLPLAIEINGPQGRFPLVDAIAVVGTRLRELTTLLSSEQEGALRNLLQGLVAREVAEKLHAAGDLIGRVNRRLGEVRTTQGIGVSVRWRRRDDLDPDLATMVDLLSRPPDLRTVEQDQVLRAALSARLDQARLDDPDAAYRDLIGLVLDYRTWHEITLLLHRPGRSDERLSRRTALSEGEKKIVSYLPLFAAVAASCDSLAESAADAPRFLLLDDAFAKVSEDNHPKLFGLLVEFDLDFIVTSERLWGTHSTVPELAIIEVIRDAGLGVIVLEHSRWDGAARTESH